MRCASCNATNPDENRYCITCGMSLTQTEESGPERMEETRPSARQRGNRTVGLFVVLPVVVLVLVAGVWAGQGVLGQVNQLLQFGSGKAPADSVPQVTVLATATVSPPSAGTVIETPAPVAVRWPSPSATPLPTATQPPPTATTIPTVTPAITLIIGSVANDQPKLRSYFANVQFTSDSAQWTSSSTLHWTFTLKNAGNDYLQLQLERPESAQLTGPNGQKYNSKNSNLPRAEQGQTKQLTIDFEVLNGPAGQYTLSLSTMTRTGPAFTDTTILWRPVRRLVSAATATSTQGTLSGGPLLTPQSVQPAPKVYPVNGRSTYSNDYYADIDRVEIASGEARVYFEARGYSDLREPSSSCIVEKPGDRTYNPNDTSLSINQAGHYKGFLKFAASIFRQGYSYYLRYSCTSDYSDALLPGLGQ